VTIAGLCAPHRIAGWAWASRRRQPNTTDPADSSKAIERKEVLGGLIHEYRCAA